jgi:hypothetical protein
MAADPEAVFAASDAWLFPVRVVGATHVRRVDDEWPAPGTRMHDQVGPWPMSVSDSTQVVECDAPHRLVLQAPAYPFGQARIELVLEPRGDGALVRMADVPDGVSGPVHRPAGPALLLEDDHVPARVHEQVRRHQSVVPRADDDRVTAAHSTARPAAVRACQSSTPGGGPPHRTLVPMR